VITVVLGGARSGKSRIAEALALEHGTPVLYVATGPPAGSGDPEWDRRVAEHRERRAGRFVTVEERHDVPGVLERAAGPVLVDSLGGWVAAHEDFVVDAGALLDALASRRARGCPTVVVSEEVGLGVHPERELGRAFRDALGALNEQVAAAADQALFVVAGRVVPLGDPP
jgi:adenosylcobinamide kinase/adenosylcobinamide-phosphate guanylyltransferase